jgi:hypothetical protein
MTGRSRYRAFAGRVSLPMVAGVALLCLAPLLPRVSTAAAADPLFSETAPIAVSIRAPFTSLQRDRSPTPAYVRGTLTYADEGGSTVTVDIRLRPRGKSRRRPDVCAFPPLRLNFPARDQTRGTLLHGQTNLKLVTYCRTADRYQQTLLREYAVYRMLNHLTDASFRVRLLEIDYVDTDRNDQTLTRYGFVIEHRRRLARRIEMPSKRPDQVPQEALEPEQASLVEVFNYMIGNTDYSLIAPAPGDPCCHNVNLYQLPDDRYLPIPYDFDMTGFVNPPYGMVSEGLPIRNVRQRLFRGFCRDGEHHRAAVERLRSAREELFAIVRGQTGLETRSAEQAIAYLQGFFDIVDDPRRLDRQILRACR